MAININRVVLTGNLTKDPELRATQSGTPVCSLRIATNTRKKDASGQWVDKPNYFDVTIWGAQGENAARFLSRGRPVAVDGRLEWREFTDRDGNKRQAVEIVADSVQFLGSRDGGGGDGGGGDFTRTDDFQPRSDPAPSGGGQAGRPDYDDDIPF